MPHSGKASDRYEAAMARRGGSGAQTFLPVAVVIAVLLFLGVVMLMVRSGRNPSGGGSSLAPATSSSTPAGSPSPSPSATPAATPSTGAATPSGTPSPGAGTPSAGASARPGGAPPQAVGPNNMPNTGPPFPWWMGLLPVSLGIGLAWALRPKPLPGDGGDGGGGGGVLARERRPVSRPRGRPASALGKKRP